MKLSKGNKVEVYSKKEVSSGSWSCAEIISGNGRSYSVRYSPMEEPVEKVPRWAIRPRPPSVDGTNVWAAGDLAESFHNSSWKQAKIIKIVGVDCYIVRLLGSPLDVMVSQSNLRVRQAWHDGHWILLGKDFEDSRSLSRNRRTEADMVKSKDRQLVVMPPRPRKRSPVGESKNHKVSVKKRKVAEKVMCLPSLAKTNDMFLTQELSEVRVNTSGDVLLGKDSLIQGTSNHIHTDSCASSVGSNNSIDDFFKVPFISLAHRSEEVKDMDYCSDAESSTGREHEEEDSCSSEEELASFHRSELSEFRSFIRTMFASGPLSWEDEEQVSSIRTSLHISNDEYSTELRNLMYANKMTSIYDILLWRFIEENTGTSLVMTWYNFEAFGALLKSLKPVTGLYLAP